MQEAVQANLTGVLPSHLTNMLLTQRTVAGSLIKQKLSDILDDVVGDSPTEHGFGFGSFPNIMGLDCLERTARSRNQSKYKILNLSDEVTPRTTKKKKESIQGVNWAVQPIWMEFLCSVVVRFWLLHLDTLTAMECRDQYLQCARRCVGYGIVKFYPARVKISILTIANEEDARRERQMSGFDEAEMGVRWYSASICESLNQDNDGGAFAPASPTWAPIESIHTCNISSNHWQGSSKVIGIVLQLSISAEEVTVMEFVTVTEDQFEADRVIERLGCQEGTRESKVEVQHSGNLTTPKLLITIGLDDIISWGYNDEELIIKFKKREGNHEDSYYSNDSDEEESEDIVTQVRMNY